MVLHSRFEGADTAATIITNGPEPLYSQFSVGRLDTPLSFSSASVGLP